MFTPTIVTALIQYWGW